MDCPPPLRGAQKPTKRFRVILLHHADVSLLLSSSVYRSCRGGKYGKLHLKINVVNVFFDIKANDPFPTDRLLAINSAPCVKQGFCVI